MKVITLHQPWATLIAIGAKKIETRSWGTKYRGDIGIHAAASVPSYAVDAVIGSAEIRGALASAGVCSDMKRCERRYIREMLEALPAGCIIAAGNLADCKAMGTGGKFAQWVEDLYLPVPEDEVHFGYYTPERFGWITEDVKKLDAPIPAKGLQRIWDWHDMKPPEKLPHVFDVPIDAISMANPWNALVLMAAGTAFDILDPAAVLSWDLVKLDAAMEWMTYCHYSASDNVVRKKRLIQPEHCKGVIR